MIRDEDIDRVKSQISMVQLAGWYGMKVDRKGRTLCPFHNDKTPSMQVYGGHDSRDGFYCFACGAAGTIFSFVMRYEGVDFETAVRRIAGMFGIPVSDGSAKPTEAEKSRYQTRMLMRQVDERIQVINRQRMGQIAELIARYGEMAERARPYGGLWCWLVGQMERLDAEWQWRFDEVERR